MPLDIGKTRDAAVNFVNNKTRTIPRKKGQESGGMKDFMTELVVGSFSFSVAKRV